MKRLLLYFMVITAISLDAKTRDDSTLSDHIPDNIKNLAIDIQRKYGLSKLHASHAKEVSLPALKNTFKVMTTHRTPETSDTMDEWLTNTRDFTALAIGWCLPGGIAEELGIATATAITAPYLFALSLRNAAFTLVDSETYTDTPTIADPTFQNKFLAIYGDQLNF